MSLFTTVLFLLTLSVRGGPALPATSVRPRDPVPVLLPPPSAEPQPISNGF